MKRISLPSTTQSHHPKKSKVAPLFVATNDEPAKSHQTYKSSTIIDALTQPTEEERNKLQALLTRINQEEEEDVDDTALLTDEEDQVDKQRRPPSPSNRIAKHTRLSRPTTAHNNEAESTQSNQEGLIKVPSVSPELNNSEVRYVPSLVEKAKLREAESEVVKEKQLAKERLLEEKNESERLAAKPVFVTKGYMKRLAERDEAMSKLRDEESKT